MYRFHITENVPYYRSFRFELEHGPYGMWPSNYRSVAFFYHYPESVLVLTDRIDVGHSSDEEIHQYYAKKIAWASRKTMPYEGNLQVLSALNTQKYKEDLLQIEGVTDDEHAWNELCEFDVKTDPDNEGIKIRKRYGVDRLGSQEVLVSVDGNPIGVWYMQSQRIARSCWMEDDFEIPEKYTKGKGKIHVRLENLGDTEWSAATYWIFSYVPRKWRRGYFNIEYDTVCKGLRPAPEVDDSN